MKVYEYSARTIQEAIDQGLEELGVAISDVTVDVLEEGSKGLFGLFGSRPAKVRITMKDEEDTDDVARAILADAMKPEESKPRKEKAEKLGLTPDQVIALAAIVEGETAKADEKGMVARLYLNRLKKNMKLQADPTVKFAIGDFALRRLRLADTRIESPWNTYYVEGLPPGPICIPEKSSIDAVLDAPEHDYIYMCAKEDFSGYHNFAVTYSDHEANAKRYQKALDERNITR